MIGTDDLVPRMVATSFRFGNSYSPAGKRLADSYHSYMRHEDIVRCNLALLIKEFRTVAEISRRSGVSEGYIRQVKNGDIQQGGISPRMFGPGAIERLGLGCKGDATWMDARHDAEWEAAGLTPSGTTTEVANQPVKAVTPQLNQTSGIYRSLDSTPNQTVQHVPLLSWEECRVAIENYEDLHGQTFPISPPRTGRLIALKMEDDSMLAPSGISFPPGSTLIFDVDKAPDHEKFTLFVGPDGHTHFRQYIVDVGRRRLQPLNPRFEPLPAPHDRTAYLGVLVLAVLPIYDDSTSQP